MQQHELAQTRQREANLTALAAIGPRKKRKMDSPWATPSGSEVRAHLNTGPVGRAFLCTDHLRSDTWEPPCPVECSVMVLLLTSV